MIPTTPDTIRAMCGDKLCDIRIDPSTHVISTIDYTHHKIHTGSAFICHYTQTVAHENDRSIIAFKTPNDTKYLHIIASAAASAAATIFVWEAPTITDNTGTALTVFNRNRTSTKTSGVINTGTNPDTAGQATYFTEVDMGDVTIGSGTEIAQAVLQAGGGPKAVGGLLRGTEEWVLKPSTLYAFIVNNTAAVSNIQWVELDWYEHTDRD